jgi:TorA maturation chaperone TorD
MEQSVVTIESRLTSGPTESPELVIEEWRARADFYRLLAGAFAEEPNGRYLQALRAPESLAALEEAGVRFKRDVTHTPLERLADDLACEFATLLASPGGCPPVESVRLTGRYQQEPCFAVKEAYRRAGFAVQKGRFEVFEDSLGVELLFVAALLEQAAAALEAGDTTAYARLDKDIKRFWTLHLGRWARGYASLVARAAQHSFYREMAALLERFAEDEIARMKLRVEDVDGGKEVPKSEVSMLVNPDEPVCNACEYGNRKA